MRAGVEAAALVPADSVRLVQKFCDDCRLRNMTAQTIESYRSAVNIFGRFLAGRGLNYLRVDRETLRDYVADLRARGRSASTLENRFSAMSSFYDYLVYEGYLPQNPVLPVRKRYLPQYKGASFGGMGKEPRRLLTVEQMSALVNSIVDPEDRAMVTLLCKTGIRRNELAAIDIEDIHWEDWSVVLKPFKKRSNRRVFFDEEAANVLQAWLAVRSKRGSADPNALFVTRTGRRVDKNAIYNRVLKYALRAGLHTPGGRPEECFSPHACRHWFTTWLRRNGCPREFIKELRGDARGDTIDIYDHIDPAELRKAYLAAIPRLGLV